MVVVSRHLVGRGLLFSEVGQHLAESVLSDVHRRAIERERDEHLAAATQHLTEQKQRLVGDIARAELEIGRRYGEMEAEAQAASGECAGADFDKDAMRKRINGLRREREALARREEMVLSMQASKAALDRDPAEVADQLYRQYPSLARPIYRSIG